LVIDERAFVFAQFHLCDVVVELLAGLLGSGQRAFGVLLVLDVNFGKPLASFHKRAEHLDSFCAVVLKPAFFAGFRIYALLGGSIGAAYVPNRSFSGISSACREPTSLDLLNR
jgi:hypothetical protein